jgi:hypothetical protein
LNKRILSIVLLSVFVLSYPVQDARATYTLPPADDTQGYVDNLIQSYNALVQSNYARRPDFSTYTANFSLYHDTGNTFNAVVMQSDPSVSGFVILTFFPIAGDTPTVTLDTNHTFQGLTGIACACENVTLASLTFLDYNNTNRYINLAFGISSADITNNGMANSLAMADYLYRYDASRIIQHSPNLSSPQPSDPFGWFNDSPIVKAIGNVLSIILFAGVIAVAVVAIMMKRVRRGLKEWLQIDEHPKSQIKKKKKAH